MYILSIGDSILQALRTLTLTVCETIYSLICFCFDIFNEMGTVTLDIDVNGIFKRVEFILGLFMLFRLTFAGIQYLVDPDAMTDKQKGIGNIIKRVLIVIILLGSTNYLFKEAYILQDRIIESRLIEKIILPGATSSSSGAGADIAWYTFSQFYTLNTKEETECNSAYKMLEQQFKDLGSMDAAYLCLNEKMNKKENVSNKQYVVNFNGLIALLCGALLLWMIVVYTVQLGIRIFQLAYLQIVAPIPIMMYLVPKGEENLKKWGKQCLSTFLDFFLRLATLDFVILVSQSLMTNQENLAAHFSTNNVFQEGYVAVILIIALFAFAKKVPELLKELFPSIGGTGFDFGLHGKSAKRIGTIAGGALAGGAVGLIGGHGIVGRAKGLVGGIGQGAISGAKGKKISEISAARAKRNKINRQASLNGSTFGGRLDARMRNMFGFETASEGIDRRISAIDEQIEAIDNSPNMRTKRQNDAIIGARKAALEEAKSQLLKENGTYSNAGLKADRDKLSYLRAHLGEKDSNGHTITTGMIQAQENLYNTSLDNASRQFIDQHATDNAEIARQMQIIENNAGTPITNFAQMDAADNAAKSSNTAIARAVEVAEHDKQDLNEQKRQLNEQKRIPQANENAINNK